RPSGPGGPGCQRLGSWRPRRTGAASRAASVSSKVLMDAKVVAFGVLEPGGLFGAQYADVTDGLQARQVVVLEDDAARFEIGDLGRDVVHAETDRGMFGLRPIGLRKQGKRRAAAPELELAVGRIADRRQAETVLVEAAGPVEIDDREHRRERG